MYKIVQIQNSKVFARCWVRSFCDLKELIDETRQFADLVVKRPGSNFTSQGNHGNNVITIETKNIIYFTFAVKY